MQLTNLIVGAQIAERMREADEQRLARVARRRDYGSSRAWTTRTRRLLGNQLVAVGEAIRRPTYDCTTSQAAKRPA
jgi:hypothetical protein